jgi:hypothetical protein
MMTMTAQQLAITDDTIVVTLTGEQIIVVPLAHYPRLLHATPNERKHWRLLGDGESIHWPDLDETLSVAQLLRDEPSGESARSLQQWLDERAGKTVYNDDYEVDDDYAMVKNSKMVYHADRLLEQLEACEARAERLAAQLRALGVEPEA